MLSIQEAVYSWKHSAEDFDDCLIEAHNRRLGCRPTATYDGKAPMSNGSFCSILAFVLLPALAQSQNLSDIKTTLTDTDPVDIGKVISRGPYSVTVKNELFTRVFRINAGTEIRRVDSTRIQIGDQVAVRCHLDNRGTTIADSIEANVDRWGGIITKVLKDTAYIKFDAPVKGTARVVFDSGTEFGYCAGYGHKRDCSFDDLKAGRHLEAVSFVLGKNELRAIRVLSIQNH